METLYVTLLLLALAAAGASNLLALAAIFILRRTPQGNRSSEHEARARRITEMAKTLSVLGAASGLICFLIHWCWGHGPTDRTPMTVGELIGAHPSFVVIALLVAGGFALAVATGANLASHARNKSTAE